MHNGSEQNTKTYTNGIVFEYFKRTNAKSRVCGSMAGALSAPANSEKGKVIIRKWHSR